MVIETQIEAASTRHAEIRTSHLLPSRQETAAFYEKQGAGTEVAAREQAMFGNGFIFAAAGPIYRKEDLLAQGTELRSNKTNDSTADQISLIDWMKTDGDSLAKKMAEKTDNRGLMVLGPMDQMRAESEKYKDPDGYFPVFTHATPKDFHLYYGAHQGRKEYSAKTLADLIKQNVPEGQPIRLLGCESGVAGGIARELARL